MIRLDKSLYRTIQKPHDGHEHTGDDTQPRFQNGNGMELSINNPDEGLIIGDKQPVPGTVPFHPGVVLTGSPGRRKIQVATGHHDRCFSGASIRLMDCSTPCRPRAGIKSLWPRFKIGSLSRGNTKSCSLRALASGFDG